MYNILLIVHEQSEHIGTISSHIRAIESCHPHDVVKIDCKYAEHVKFSLFDVVILHYSLVIAYPSYISPRLAEKLQKFSGLTILFIQDEYRWIDRTAAAMRNLG